MNKLKNIFLGGLLAILLVAVAYGQLSVPGGTVIDDNVTVDSADVLRHPNKTVFFDNNLQPFTTCATLATPVAGDFILFSDTSCCGGLRKTNALDFLGSACAVIGPGTGGVLPIWLAGACSTTIGDSFIRQACGNLVYENGANDFIFDFSTNLTTGPVTLTAANVTGTNAVMTSNQNQRLLMGGVTVGDVRDSGLLINGGILSPTGGESGTTLRFIDVSSIQGMDPGEEILILSAGTGSDGWLFNVDGKQIFRLTPGIVDIGNAGGTVDVDLRHSQSVATGGNGATIKVDDLTADRIHQRPDEVGTYVVSSESGSIVTINADNFVLSMTAGIMLIDSNDPTASNRTFTIDISTMAVGMPYSLRFAEVGSDQAELLNTGVYFLAGDYRPDRHDMITVYTDGTNVYEMSRSANRN